jgi:hypothetical protein
MKKLAILFAGLFIMAISVQNVNAQTASAETAATIITPIAINKTVDLNFGNIVANVAGNVTVAPNGSRSSTGPTLPTATPGTITAASFNVTGLANATYAITIENATFDVTRDGGTETMEVNTIVTSPSATGTLNGTGAETITVGATLAVGLNQAAGLYENDDELEITVAYN